MEKGFRRPRKTCRRTQILLTLENADFVHDLDLLVKMTREIDSKWLKITLDVGIRREVPRSQVLQESKPEVTAVFRLMLEHTLSMEKDS